LYIQGIKWSRSQGWSQGRSQGEQKKSYTILQFSQ